MQKSSGFYLLLTCLFTFSTASIASPKTDVGKIQGQEQLLKELKNPLEGHHIKKGAKKENPLPKTIKLQIKTGSEKRIKNN